MFIFAQHKLVAEKPLLKKDYEDSPDFYEKQVANLNKVEVAVQNFVKLLKQMEY